jgi:murein DD-endopeptidase MepM/ murein hydrolase activator NlpD
MLHGIVHKVGYDKRSGIFVTLRHGDITVSYCHLSKVAVRKGDQVAAGTIVGITGNTGRSTGEHLHITCKLKGKYVDPIGMLRFLVHYQK